MMRVSLTVMCVAFLAASAFAAAPAPTLVNYQGKLVDSNGDPLATGNYIVKFSIYDAATDGTQIWGPQIFGEGHGDEVPVVNGYFNVVLGPEDHSDPPGGPRPIERAFSAPERYLEVTVKKGADPEVVIAPRQRLLSVPYAMKASNGCPAGTILPFAGSNVPEGWLLCNGAVVTIANYPDLFAAIGTAWGDPAPPGTDFNLPDLRGRVPRGVDAGSNRDPGRTARAASAANGNQGDAVGSVQDDAAREHNHAVGSLKTRFSASGTVARFSRLGPYYSPFKDGDGAQDGDAQNEAPKDIGPVMLTYSTNYTMTGISVAAETSTGSTYLEISGSTAGQSNTSSAEDTHPDNAYVNYIIKY
jgi:hypothetical protein